MVFSFLRRKRELSHAEALELLSIYMDGRLSPGQAAKVETHLGRCGSCRNELESLRATRQLLQMLPSVRPPRSFTLEAAPRPIALPRSFFYLRAATAVAAAAFAALVAVGAVLPMAGLPAATPNGYRATEATAPAGAVSGAVPATQAEPKAARVLKQPAAETGSLAAPAPASAPTPPPAPAAAPRAAPAAKAEAAPTKETVAPAPALRAAQVAPTEAPAADAAAPAPGAQPPPAAAAAALPAQPEGAAGVAPPVAPAPAAPALGATAMASEAVPSGATVGGAGQPDEGIAKGVEPGSSEDGRNAAGALPYAAEPSGSPASSEFLPLLPFFQMMQAAVGALVLVLAVATGAIWWRYRRRNP